MNRRTLSLLALPAIATAVIGCTELGAVLDETGMATALSALVLAGVTPAENYGETGQVQFSVLPREETGLVRFANLQKEGLKVEVENDDGTFSDCEYQGGEQRPASAYNTLALLLDGSGSMELEYPVAIHGDLCVTCPHDPNRYRIGAAEDLIRTVNEAAPESRMTVAEFGPAPTSGMYATRIHEDYTTNAGLLVESLDRVMGYEPLGTPLYDSLAEMILRTEAEAVEFEAEVATDDTIDAGDVIPDQPALPWEEYVPVEEDVVDGPVAEPLATDVRRYVVVLSDGVDNESVDYDFDSVLRLAKANDVTIFAVGLGPASATAVGPVGGDAVNAVRHLQALANATGGFYASVERPEDLEELYASIASALTQGYQVEEYVCIPKPTHDTPIEDCDPPVAGSRVNGRVAAFGRTMPWAMVSP